MIRPAEIEQQLTDVARRRDEAEAVAARAQDNLIRHASGQTPLLEVDPDQVRAAGDDYAGAVERLKLLDEWQRALRRLLM